MLAFMVAIVCGTFTFVSCGDDEVAPEAPKPSYTDFFARVRIDRDKDSNPFQTDPEGEKRVVEHLTKIMYQELEKIDGVIEKDGSHFFDVNRRNEIYDAMISAMNLLESTMQNQDLYLDGKINCAVRTSSGLTAIWEKEFTYTQPSNRFSDNDINYCVINDNEVGVVYKDVLSKYTGEIVIPETVENNGKTYTVTTIGPKAFYGCNITSISLPKTLTTLYNECFSFARELKSITLPGKLKNYVNTDSGSLGGMRILRLSGVTEVVLEEGITDMCEDMFNEVQNLQKVVLPSTITEIPKSCFDSEINLTDITVNGVITNIASFAFVKTGIRDLSVFKFNDAKLGENAFGACPNLEKINIPEGVSSIGDDCFSDCKSAVSVTIPASVTSMGINVFARDSSLTKIHVKGDNPATLKELANGIAVDAFSKLDFAGNGITIYVPSSSVEAYKKASVWSKYADYIKGE